MSYFISKIEDQDVEKIIRFLKRTFYIEEPLYKGISYCKSEHDYTPDLDDYVRSCLPGVSFKATDRDGNVIGVLVCQVCPLINLTDILYTIKNCKCAKYKKTIQMMVLREMILEIWEKYPEEKQLFDIKMASTDPEWRNKGIMNKLMDEAEKAARQLNLRIIQIGTSSYYSAKSAESRGFKCVFSKLYSEFMLDNRPLILTEAPHLEDKVFIKELY